MSALSFLDGLSGWWWLALALGLIVFEMMSFTYFLIWIGAAAAVTGVALLAVPTLGGATQLTIFALLGLIFTVAGRAATKRWPCSTRVSRGSRPRTRQNEAARDRPETHPWVEPERCAAVMRVRRPWHRFDAIWLPVMTPARARHAAAEYPRAAR